MKFNFEFINLLECFADKRILSEVIELNFLFSFYSLLYDGKAKEIKQ